MSSIPEHLNKFDVEKTDTAVRAHLTAEYLEHPTRGPFVKSRKLYEELKSDIDDQFTVVLFGMFCESRTYLEKWSRGYKGSARYRIIREELEKEPE